jgi:EAL domain-containing protein (putative c-di-GMP-specific phosphodiesterase class I)
MAHFARTAGCRLVAEGFETDAEATLLGHGVEHGQGYLLGRLGRAAHPRPLRKPRAVDDLDSPIITRGALCRACVASRQRSGQL